MFTRTDPCKQTKCKQANKIALMSCWQYVDYILQKVAILAKAAVRCTVLHKVAEIWKTWHNIIVFIISEETKYNIAER